MAAMRWCDALVPVLAQEFGRSTGETASVVYSFAIAYGVMQLLYGPWGDRVGKFKVVGYATAACTVAAAASALAPGLGWLVAARVLHGAAAAGIIPMSMAWIGDHVPLARRQTILARLMANTVLGMIVGQWLAGVFADTLGWRIGFGVLVGMFAVAAWGLVRHVPPMGDAPGAIEAGGAAPAMGAVARMRAVWQLAEARRVLAIVAAEGGFAFSAVAFAPSHLHQQLGLAVSMTGALMALYGVGGLLYSRTVHLMLRHMAPLTMAGLGGLVVGASWLGMASVLQVSWAVPLCLLAGLGFYMVHNTLQMRATQMAPAHRGTAVSLFACALFIGQSLAMLLAAWVVDRWGTPVMLAGCGIGLLLVAWMVARLPADPAPHGG